MEVSNFHSVVVVRCVKQPLDLRGKRFGRLLVLDKPPKRIGVRKSIGWDCLCNCGTKKSIISYFLTSGLVNSCGCLHREAAGQFKGYGEISGSFWTQIKGHSRGRVFTITIQEAWELFLEQNRQCAITGVELSFGTKEYVPKSNSRILGRTASLDRIDSTGGYVHSNVQWVHKRINMMKGTLTMNEFLDWCQRVTKWKFEVVRD